jgi:protein arginine kinase activator
MKCNKSIATVKLTRITKGQVEELSLCQSCASEISPYQKKLAGAQANLDSILAGLLASEKEKKRASDVDITCRGCGLPFGTYRESLFLGCAECYDSFGEHLLADLRKFHGSTSHRGKIPKRFQSKIIIRQDIQQLRKQMDEAIEKENFELAAELRDKIKALEKQTEQ